MACEQDYWNQMYANACDQSAASLLWRPKLFVDGNQWCALYGDNLQDGVAGFGDTPDKAMRNFDLNWCEQKVGSGTARTKGEEKLPIGIFLITKLDLRVKRSDKALWVQAAAADGEGAQCGN